MEGSGREGPESDPRRSCKVKRSGMSSLRLKLMNEGKPAESGRHEVRVNHRVTHHMG